MTTPPICLYLNGNFLYSQSSPTSTILPHVGGTAFLQMARILIHVNGRIQTIRRSAQPVSAPARRMMASRRGKMPTTSVSRRIPCRPYRRGRSGHGRTDEDDTAPGTGHAEGVATVSRWSEAVPR